MACKFPVHCCLGFYVVTALSLLLKAVLLLFETIGQCSDIMESKMVARGKFKSSNNISLNHFRLLYLLIVVSPLSS